MDIWAGYDRKSSFYHHLRWVLRPLDRVCVEPDNQWFATGAADRTIKIWDLASGTLKLTLTGHISAVRGVSIQP